MAYYDINGNALNSSYDVNGDSLGAVYDVDGNLISGASDPYIHGTSYAFSEMTMSDPSNVITASTKVKNASTSHAYTSSLSGNALTPTEEYDLVTYTCNIPTAGNNFGIWMYIAPESVPCYAGRTFLHNGIGRMRIKINNTWYNLEEIRAGWSYQFFENNSSFTNITSIVFGALNNIDYTTESTVILDSVEVGFSMKKAHIMFNLDCVPTNFWDVGYPLFEQYGLKCTLHYPISSTTATVGADSDYLDIPKHNELKNKGYGFAVYSGWQTVEQYGEAVPSYDNPTKRQLFEAHAERMWNVNRDSNIDSPSCIHGTGFFWGPEYERANLVYNFLMIRHGNASTAGKQSIFAFFDEGTRTMIPTFMQGAYTADATLVTNVKNKIDYTIKTKQNLQLGCHAIKPSDYEPPSGGDMYIGVAAMDAILAYVKQKVDAGDLICCTTEQFVSEVAPDLYDAWNATKSHSVT